MGLLLGGRPRCGNALPNAITNHYGEIYIAALFGRRTMVMALLAPVPYMDPAPSERRLSG
jgi:hypothetical protein